MKLISSHRERFNARHLDAARMAKKRARKSRQALRSRPRLELLEDRMMLAGYFVNSNGDTNTPGTLRYAINQANGNTDPANSIGFFLSDSQHTITPGSAGLGALPAITKPVDIEGYSEPGFSGVPLIEIDGAAAAIGAIGLVLAGGSSGSVIQGLVIDGFGAGSGIVIGSSNDSVIGCYVGAVTTGAQVKLNYHGIEIDVSGSGTTIGGTSAGAGNVISGNNSEGVVAYGRRV